MYVHKTLTVVPLGVRNLHGRNMEKPEGGFRYVIHYIY